MVTDKCANERGRGENTVGWCLDVGRVARCAEGRQGGGAGDAAMCCVVLCIVAVNYDVLRVVASRCVDNVM